MLVNIVNVQTEDDCRLQVLWVVITSAREVDAQCDKLVSVDLS